MPRGFRPTEARRRGQKSRKVERRSATRPASSQGAARRSSLKAARRKRMEAGGSGGALPRSTPLALSKTSAGGRPKSRAGSRPGTLPPVLHNVLNKVQRNKNEANGHDVHTQT